MKSSRQRMLDEHLRQRGITDPLVLRAMAAVPRERFVSDEMQDLAYEDRPLPIACGQTISQPYIVAYMLQQLRLKKGDTVLDVGTGSGYMAAVLAHMVRHVFSVELEEELVESARELLGVLEITNVEIKVADGHAGWPEQKMFSAIVVSCAADTIPDRLLDQLSPGGRLVIPVTAERGSQRLLVVEKGSDGKVSERRDLPVRFVPMR